MILTRRDGATQPSQAAQEAAKGYVELPAAELLLKYHIESFKLTPAGLLLETSTEPAEIATPPRR